jgi:hypothetical protein
LWLWKKRERDVGLIHEVGWDGRKGGIEAAGH